MTEALQCCRCKHIWLPRSDNPDPVLCAKCKSPYWNTPKKPKKPSKKPPKE